MRNILKHIFTSISFISLFLMIGTVGQIDLNEVDEYKGFKSCVVYLVIFGLFAILAGLCKNYQPNDEYEDL